MLDPVIPLLSALISGVVVKVVDHAYIKSEKRFDDAVAIRQELRAEVKALQGELKTLREELDHWKDRYFDLASRYQGLLAACQTLRAELDELREHDDLRAYQQFRRAVLELRLQKQTHAPPTPSEDDDGQQKKS